MHAYLFVGDQDDLQKSLTNLAKQKNAAIYPIQLESIKDTRAISAFIKLSQNKNIIIAIANIHKASNEALQAFLKDLEEPNKKIYFALHTPNENLILPTIQSRCQIVYLSKKNISEEVLDLPKKYLSLPIGDKLDIIDQFKDRNKAIEFIDQVLYLQHKSLLANPTEGNVDTIKIVQNTRKNLSLNGNIFLHLSLMSILIEKKS